MRRGLDPRTPKRGQPEPMTAKRTLGGDMRIHRRNVRAGSGAGWVSQRMMAEGEELDNLYRQLSLLDQRYRCDIMGLQERVAARVLEVGGYEV